MSKTFLDKNNNVLYTGYETHEIVANPTLAGTEANLTGLQVGDTKYAIPQGGGEQHLYLHRINFTLLGGDLSRIIEITGSVLNSSNTPLVVQDEETGLYNVEELLSLDYDYLTLVLINASNETLISSQPFTAFDYNSQTKMCHFDRNGSWIEDSSDTLVWGYFENDPGFDANEKIIQKI